LKVKGFLFLTYVENLGRETSVLHNPDEVRIFSTK